MLNNLTLDSAQLNTVYIITGFNSNLSFYEKERLQAYGFVAGCSIKVIRKSLFGNTLQVFINNCNLIIRKKDATNIILKIKQANNYA